MKVLHVLYSGLGGHGNVFFSMVSDNKDNAIVYEALFYGIEDMREEYKTACATNSIPSYFVKKFAGKHVQFNKDIADVIKKSSPDIIFLHSSVLVFAARLAKVSIKNKCSIVVRETQANHLKTKAEWIALFSAMLLADKIVFLTPEFRGQVKAKFKSFFNARKVAVISNGVDMDVFHPAVNLSDNGIIVIGMQSRIVKIKDHLTLVDAFAILLKQYAGKQSLQLKIAGDGEYKNTVVAHAEQAGISTYVDFTGMLSEKELVTFLQNTDIYVHASLGETMSTAVMQAMACRLPVVASDVNGINNMIDNGQTGLLVPAKDPGKMADAISMLIEDKQKRDSLAENAYQHSLKAYSNKTMMQLYKKVFLSA